MARGGFVDFVVEADVGVFLCCFLKPGPGFAVKGGVSEQEDVFNRAPVADEHEFHSAAFVFSGVIRLAENCKGRRFVSQSNCKQGHTSCSITAFLFVLRQKLQLASTEELTSFRHFLDDVELLVHLVHPSEGLQKFGGKKAERVIAFRTEHKHCHALLSWLIQTPRLIGHQRCRPFPDAILEVWIIEDIDVDENGVHNSIDEEGASKGVGINLKACWHDKEYERLDRASKEEPSGK